MFPLSQMLKSFIRTGTLTVEDAEGKIHKFGAAAEGAPNVTMKLTDPKLYRALFFNPELHAGEAYMDGRMSFPGSNLRDFLTLFSINRRALKAHPMQKVFQRASRGMKRFQQYNPVGKAQQNVAHHYDIGNDLYEMFLDEGMFYSCAYFRDENDTLEEAQINKCRLIAAKLQLKPGMKVLDIGCGWGGLAMYLARIAGVEVLGVTLSKEQLALAQSRAKAAGLDNKVRFELLDYRKLNQKFDRIVSVGMFEHVGVAHYGEFFSKINELMSDDGIMLLHSIGKMSPPGTASPWLRKYIFPGAYSPALSEVFPAVENNQLWVTDLEFLRVHYATTLLHWHQRFEKSREKIAKLYDERFCRMFEFYLISAEMMFRTGAQEVFHMQLSRKRDAAPIVRDYIIDEQHAMIAKEKAGA
ncbi:MAG: class I SAM-dependent methyltransferase [Hyphomicrobium sp.]|nr:class I SAM-dependent methyltransferase [Hyphomicrobium sp.]